jgi:hypothetical protein
LRLISRIEIFTAFALRWAILSGKRPDCNKVSMLIDFGVLTREPMAASVVVLLISLATGPFDNVDRELVQNAVRVRAGPALTRRLAVALRRTIAQ